MFIVGIMLLLYTCLTCYEWTCDIVAIIFFINKLCSTVSMCKAIIFYSPK